MKRYLLLVNDVPVVSADLGAVDILMHKLDGTQFHDNPMADRQDFDAYRDKLSREWGLPLPLGTPMAIVNPRKGRTLSTSRIQRPQSGHRAKQAEPPFWRGLRAWASKGWTAAHL